MLEKPAVYKIGTQAKPTDGEWFPLTGNQPSRDRHQRSRSDTGRFGDPSDLTRISPRIANEAIIAIRANSGLEIPVAILTNTDVDDGIFEYQTPADPQAAYEIGLDDYRKSTRVQKLRAYQLLDLDGVNIIRHPLGLSLIAGRAETTLYSEVLKQFYPELDFQTDQAKVFLASLRVQLDFPRANLTGKPDIDGIRQGTLFIPEFYPSDWGPLAVPVRINRQIGFALHEGTKVMLPLEPEELSGARGRFYLAEPVTNIKVLQLPQRG